MLKKPVADRYASAAKVLQDLEDKPLVLVEPAKGTAAAKRHEDEVIGIMPALDRDKTHGPRHLRFGHAHDGLRRLRN